MPAMKQCLKFSFNVRERIHSLSDTAGTNSFAGSDGLSANSLACEGLKESLACEGLKESEIFTSVIECLAESESKGLLASMSVLTEDKEVEVEVKMSNNSKRIRSRGAEFKRESFISKRVLITLSLPSRTSGDR